MSWYVDLSNFGAILTLWNGSNTGFPGISWRTHWGNGLAFCMLMYLEHLHNWIDYGHSLLIILCSVDFPHYGAPLTETGHIWGFWALSGERVWSKCRRGSGGIFAMLCIEFCLVCCVLCICKLPLIFVWTQVVDKIPLLCCKVSLFMWLCSVAFQSPGFKKGQFGGLMLHWGYFIAAVLLQVIKLCASTTVELIGYTFCNIKI